MIFGCAVSEDIFAIEKVGDNALILYEGGIAAMRRSVQTQFIADLTVEIQKGSGIRFAMRSVANDYLKHPALYFDFTTNGLSLSETGKPTLYNDKFRAKLNSKSRIRLMSDGKISTVVVDCDTVFNLKTELPASEHIIVSSLNNSRILLTGIDFEHTKNK